MARLTITRPLTVLSSYKIISVATATSINKSLAHPGFGVVEVSHNACPAGSSF